VVVPVVGGLTELATIGAGMQEEEGRWGIGRTRTEGRGRYTGERCAAWAGEAVGWGADGWAGGELWPEVHDEQGGQWRATRTGGVVSWGADG
jgi:hypothetical protein